MRDARRHLLGARRFGGKITVRSYRRGKTAPSEVETVLVESSNLLLEGLIDHLDVAHGGVEGLVAHELLDDVDAEALLEEVDVAAVP